MNWFWLLMFKIVGNGPEAARNREIMDLALRNKLARALDQGEDIHIMSYGEEKLLLFAVRKGYDKTVELLLQKGSDPNFRDHRGLSALDVAICSGHERILELLLLAGADLQYGRCVTLCRSSDEKIIKLLLQAGAVPKPISLCFARGDSWELLFEEIFKRFFEGVRPIDEQVHEEGIIFFSAIYIGSASAVQKLLQIGLNPNMRDGECINALEVANSRDVIANADAITALEIAADRDFPQIITLLLANGAGPERYVSPAQQHKILYAFSQHREASYPYE